MPIWERVGDSATIARDYAHQLHANALARADLLVRGCCEPLHAKDPEGDQYILHAATELAADLVGSAAEGTFVAYCSALWYEDRLRERKWKHRTINDAIDEAFARLTKRGILALQNVGGTHATAWAEVLAEIDRRATRARNTLGGTYFHSQDTERGIAGQGLSLGFGAVNGEPDDDLKIARAVVTALRDEGVAYEWDGSRDTRVRILPFEWRKRRTTRPPPRQPPVAWQTYVHPDGRTWSVAGLNNHVHIRIGYPDGEVVERRTPDPNLAGAIAALVESQQADGFERSEVESKLRLL